MMDILSDVLRVVRMNGGGFLNAEFSVPWSIVSAPPDELARQMTSRAETITLFHIFVEGEGWISVDGWEPFRLNAGNVIIFPESPSHTISSDPSLTPKPIEPLLTFSDDKKIPEINCGGEEKTTRFVCVYTQCDQRFNPLIGALPPMLLVRKEQNAKAQTESTPADLPTVEISSSDDWLERTLWHIAGEALDNRPGCSVILSRLTELFYIEILRRYMQQLPAKHRGWLSAIQNPEVGRALRLLHQEPTRKWTVRELGQAIGLSRSTLAKRFVDLVGISPIQYLTNWRMQLAKSRLLRANMSISQIAEDIGYGSAAAFSRAFKQHTGDPPATWRGKNLET